MIGLNAYSNDETGRLEQTPAVKNMALTIDYRSNVTNSRRKLVRASVRELGCNPRFPVESGFDREDRFLPGTSKLKKRGIFQKL